MDPAQTFIAFLQTCLTPLVMISGVGLMLLSLTNRLGRTIDRCRTIANELHRGQLSAPEQQRKLPQLKILFIRSRLLTISIVAISLSILFSSLIILALVLMHFWQVNLYAACMGLFVLSVVAIIVSAAFLCADVSLTLSALRLEIREHL